MTTLDTSPLSTDRHTSERPGALVDRLAAGAPYALAFGGQGGPWLEPLAELVRDHALEADLAALVAEASARLEPVAGELARAGRPFDPMAWVDVLAVGESAEDDDAPALPAGLDDPAVSVPGILLTQLAGLRALIHQGLDPRAVGPGRGHRSLAGPPRHPGVRGCARRRAAGRRPPDRRRRSASSAAAAACWARRCSASPTCRLSGSSPSWPASLTAAASWRASATDVAPSCCPVRPTSLAALDGSFRAGRCRREGRP